MTATSATTLPKSLQEFERWAPTAPGPVEWTKGELIVGPLPRRDHQAIVRAITACSSGTHDAGPVSLRVGADSDVGPDVGVNPRKRPEVDTIYDTDADVLVEVVSPGRRGRDRIDKRELYEESGAREYWIAEQRGDLTVFQRDGDGRRHQPQGGQQLRTDPAT